MRIRHAFPAALVLCIVAATVAIVLSMSRSREAGNEDKRTKDNKVSSAGVNKVKAADKSGPEQRKGRTTTVVRHDAREANESKIRNPPSESPEQERERLRVEAEIEKIRREPIKGAAEQLLMMATPAARGDSIPPLPITQDMNEALESEAEKMLVRVVKVEEHDDVTSLEIKERLLALREEWIEAKNKGMTFADFLRRREGRAQNDAEHYADAVGLEREYFNDSTLSDEGYLEARKKINNLLNIEGFKPLPPLEEDEEEEEAPATNSSK